MAFCFAHPAVEATGTCDDCKKPICMKCTKGTLEGFMCPPCAHRRYGRQKLVTALKVAGMMSIIVALALIAIVGFGRKSKPEPTTPKVDPNAEQDPFIASLREQRDQAPCDKEHVRKLIKELLKLDRNADAVDDGNAYFAKCGPFPRLKWDLIYALQQLGRYSEAIKHESDLIERDPFDSDFWWWRGEDRARTNDPVLALADFRQSFALSDDAGGSRFAAARILDSAGPGGNACEGVFALDYFVGFHEGEIADDLAERVRGLDTSAQCRARRGQGTYGLPAPGPDLTVTVTIGGVDGTFLVDERCGTTALATAFAQLVQVQPRPGPAIPVIAGGSVRSGPQASATLKVGAATAPATELVIVDGLPSGIDGVLGLSFLWQFHLERRDDGGLTLSDGST